MKFRRLVDLGLCVVFLAFINPVIYSHVGLDTISVTRKVRDLYRIDLYEVLPQRSTEGFQPFSDWIDAFESLPDYACEELTLAFTYKGKVMQTVKFKIPKRELLVDPAQFKEVADYLARLVLFGMAFIGGDGVVGTWSEDLKEYVENIFQHSMDTYEDGVLYKEWRGMINYLETVYGRKYQFQIKSAEQIKRMPKAKIGFLMEVDKAIIDMNPNAHGFIVPNAGPYGLPGVIEAYLNQNGVYYKFKELVEKDKKLREELERLDLLPALEPPGFEKVTRIKDRLNQLKQIKRSILLHTQDLLMSEEEINREIKHLEAEIMELQEKREKGEINMEEFQKTYVEKLNRINKLQKVKLLSPESKEKIARIYYEIGIALGTTIKIAQKFMDIDNVVITGQATEGRSGEIIKEAAMKMLSSSDVRIWLPSEDPIKETGEESALKKFEIDESKLGSYGQAIAMAAKISEKIYGAGNITKGRVIGIDGGSTDIKIVYVDNGKVLFAKKYRWDSGKITDNEPVDMEENYLGHKEIILGLIKLAQIAAALQSPEYRDEKYNELRELVRRLEESDGGEYKSKEGENLEPLRFADIQKAIKMAEELKVKYKEVAKFEGFALSWAGAVLENRIVGRASIVAGLSDEGFKDKIIELGKKIAEEYGDVPYLVINDGEAAAIMAVMMGLKNVLGLAFGTSTGGGYFGGE